MEVSFSPLFVKTLQSFPDALREEVITKINLLQDEQNHEMLRVHKLKGRLKGYYAFSVNYRFRILFQYVGKPRRAYLLTVGDHDVYDR